MMAAAAVFVSIATGWCLVAALWPADASERRHLAFRFCLGAGLGLWVSSCAYFLALGLGTAGVPALLVIDAALFAAAFGLMRAARGRKGREATPPAAPARSSASQWSRWPLAFLVALATSIAITQMLWSHLERPYGHWDAWAIWNLKAKFLHAAGDQWLRAFSRVVDFSHPDYPLLLPLNVARLWTYGGTDSPALSTALAMLFGLLSLATLLVFVTERRGWMLGSLSALTLLAIPRFLEHATHQLADIPVGFYLLAALCTLTMALSREEPSRKLLALAGLLVGAAAWTKNEGSVMAVGILVGLAAVNVRRGELRRFGRSLLGFLLGLAVAAVPLLLLKTTLSARNNHLVSLTLASTLDRMTDASRHLMILLFFVWDAWSMLGTPLLIGLAAWAGLSGWRPTVRSAVALGGVALGITLVGYYAVFLTTPHDLQLLLVTSTSRLLLQILPSVLLLYFLSVGDPGHLEPKRSHTASPARA